MKLILIFSLGAAAAYGQLTLPDFFLDEEFPDEAPAEQVRPAEQEPARPPSQIDENARRLMMNMNVGQRHQVHHRVQRQQEQITEAIERYLGGPDDMVITLLDQEGGETKLRLQNQTLLVDTGLFRLPVRLHEVKQLRVLEAGKRVSLTLQNGEEVSGAVLSPFFLVQDAQGAVELRAISSAAEIRIDR